MPAELEEQLATMEAAYADREPEQIRRTWFRLSHTDTGFKFMVTQQTAQ
jgi:predicted lipid carrier protein YhbT